MGWEIDGRTETADERQQRIVENLGLQKKKFMVPGIIKIADDGEVKILGLFTIRKGVRK